MKVTQLDPVLAGKLRARNCGFSLKDGLLTIEPGLTSSLKKADERALKPIKKTVLGFYPNAVIIDSKDMGRLILICSLE